MGIKVNSFTETVNQLVQQTNIALEFAVKTNQSLTTQEDVVTMYIEQNDSITGDPSIISYSIPSYNTTINKVNAVNQTVDTFVKGEGKVLLKDGTYREVKTIPVPISPVAIVNIDKPSKFSSKNNWFFESMMFPQLTISFNLKDKIDDRSDRLGVKRVIFDNFNETETQWFLENIASKQLSYHETKKILNNYDKRYWEDDEITHLPLFTEPYTGYFNIVDKEVQDNKTWFILNTINYGITTDEPTVKNIELAVGNQLRFNNSIYKIVAVEVTEKKVQLLSMVGMDHPTINKKFEIYNPPFSSKIVEIPIGYNECNAIFLKGINEDYNLLADDWGSGVSFFTNNLVLENSSQTLESYYFENVVDFGKQLEGEAKEKFIPSLFGIKPDAPSIQANQFKVNQVNTQLNASIDTEDIKNTQSQIESTKTIIKSLKLTIAQQKAELVELIDPAHREDLQSKIDHNIVGLSKKTVEYQSYVKSLSTIAYENQATLGSPKYRARGFFDIPEGKTTTINVNEKKQEVIQFDISYRYIRLDGTGNPLNTYSYTDPSSGQQITGTYSDWNNIQSNIKTKVYNEKLGYFTWEEEIISDGETLNINQIDLSITKGEKLEVKIRSISEAGWPQNPKKSDWSNSVIIEFPPNLSGSNQIRDILADAIEEDSQIKLQETLNATGVITHLNDSYPNPNSGSGTYFKHQSRFLSYDAPAKDLDGNVKKENSIDIQSLLENVDTKSYVKISRPPSSSNTTYTKTVTILEVLQKLINEVNDAYDELSNPN